MLSSSRLLSPVLLPGHSRPRQPRCHSLGPQRSIGDVKIIAHRSEMGTGCPTCLPMILADELETDEGRVTIVQAQALGDVKYASQNTDGSCSVRDFYEAMRSAAMVTSASSGYTNQRPEHDHEHLLEITQSVLIVSSLVLLLAQSGAAQDADRVIQTIEGRQVPNRQGLDPFTLRD